MPRGAHPGSPGKSPPLPCPRLCCLHPGRLLAHLPGVRWGRRALWQSCGVNRGRNSPLKPLPSGAQGPADPSSNPHPSPSPPGAANTGPTELHRLWGSDHFIGPAYSPGPPTCTARPGLAHRPSPGRVAFQPQLFKPPNASCWVLRTSLQYC